MAHRGLAGLSHAPGVVGSEHGVYDHDTQDEILMCQEFTIIFCRKVEKKSEP